MPLESFLARLDRHERLFDLSGDLGERLLETAAAGVEATFKAESSPDGEPWPPLTSEYARTKARLFPGMPMGVATGEMREGLDGDRSQSESEARWTFGVTEAERQKAVWFQNRRKFVGFTEDSEAKSRSLLETYFKDAI